MAEIPVAAMAPMEHAMSDNDGDAGDDEARDAFERHSRALNELIQDYLEAQDIPDQIGALMVISLGINLRMLGYALDVDKPSVSGVKLDLDRFGREIESVLRDSKKGAEEFIERIKLVLAAEEAANEDDEDEGDGSK
jgi:hypothetical protein